VTPFDRCRQDFLAVRLAGAFLAVVLVAVRLAGAFFAVVFFVAVLLAGAAFVAVVFLAVVVFLAGDVFFAVVFLAVLFLAVVFFAVVFFAVVLLAAVVFFAGVDFLAVDFFAVVRAAPVVVAVLDFFAAAAGAASVSFGSFFAPETTFLRSAPAANFGTAVFLALMRAPVWGLRTQRASRTRFSNEPNPVIATFSPLATSRVIVSRTDSSACCACLRFPS
jgi:hypothetical protein